MKLRIMQQDALIRTTDRQQKSTLIFTFVSLKFIPLSFFASYWGINFSDIRDTERTSKSYIWKVFGPLALLIILITLFWAVA